MRRQTVRNAYKDIRPDELERERMLDHILSVASDSAAVRKDEPTMKRMKKKPLLIAAMIGLMIFLMGAAVVALNLQDLKMGEYSYTETPYINENGEKIPETQKTRDVISLQGIQGSPNQMAAQEWYEYEQDYLENHAEKIENDFQRPQDYEAYFVGNQEMVDKVDEIAAKYGLKLAGPGAVTQTYEQDVFFEALGLDGLTNPDADVTVKDGSGYFYGCGNFKLEFWLTMTGEETQWSHENLISYSYKDKKYFDTVFFTIADVDAATQWNYTLADGTEVLIVSTGDAARIFCDREDAFLSASFDTAYVYDDGTRDTMTVRDIELMAEALDFTVKPQKPDMAEAKKRIAEMDAEYLAQQEARLEESGGDPLRQNSYEDIITLFELGEDHYFVLKDIDGDGVDEFFIGHTADSFYEVYTMKDGKTKPLVGNYLCENGVTEVFWDADDYNYIVHGYYKLEGGEVTLLDYVCYDKAADCWANCKYAATWGDPITEAEAKEIIASYVRVDLELRPMSEFPKN